MTGVRQQQMIAMVSVLTGIVAGGCGLGPRPRTMPLIFQAELTPQTLEFVTTLGGPPATPQFITLKNTGTAVLDPTPLDLKGPSADAFLYANRCPAELAPGDSCVIRFGFFPSAPGTYTLAFVLDDRYYHRPGQTTFTVTLKGTALAPTPPSR